MMSPPPLSRFPARNESEPPPRSESVRVQPAVHMGGDILYNFPRAQGRKTGHCLSEPMWGQGGTNGPLLIRTDVGPEGSRGPPRTTSVRVQPAVPRGGYNCISPPPRALDSGFMVGGFCHHASLSRLCMSVWGGGHSSLTSIWGDTPEISQAPSPAATQFNSPPGLN
jgi:hypothetical protein